MSEAHVRKTHLVASPDGARLALVEDGRVIVVDAATYTVVSEIGVSGAPQDTDVAFVTGGHLAIASREATKTTLFLVDPSVPEKLGESTFSTPVRIGAVSATTILLLGTTVSLADASTPRLTTSTLPIRYPATAAARIGVSRFLIAAGGSLEDWDSETRMPLRRMRAERASSFAFVGGNAGRVWLVATSEPRALDTITIATKATRRLELPEPALSIDAHVNGEQLVIVGVSRAVYVVHLSRNEVTRVWAGPVDSAVWHGADTIALQPGPHRLQLLVVGAKEPREIIITTSVTEMPSPVAPPPRLPALEIEERLEEYAAARARSNTSPPPSDWRRALATWFQHEQITDRAVPPPVGGRLQELASRFDLDDDHTQVVARLYGAELVGYDGVAPIDLAAQLRWQWATLLSGPLIASGVIRRRRGRIVLTREVRSYLDEAPPCRGQLVTTQDAPTPVDLRGALVVPDTVSDAELALWTASRISAVFVANRAGHRRPHRFFVEARVRGVTPLIAWGHIRDLARSLPARVVVRVGCAEDALGLQLPVLGWWPAVTTASPALPT